MRISIKLLLFLLCVAPLSTYHSLGCMEYGDSIQATGVYATSWLYEAFKSPEDLMLTFKVESEKQLLNSVDSPNVILSAGVVPVMTLSKKCSLAIACAALSYWSAKKIYYWLNSNLEHGE